MHDGHHDELSTTVSLVAKTLFVFTYIHVQALELRHVHRKVSTSIHAQPSHCPLCGTDRSLQYVRARPEHSELQPAECMSQVPPDCAPLSLIRQS